MKQFVGIALMGIVLGYVIIKEKVREVSASYINKALETDRQKTISARRCR